MTGCRPISQLSLQACENKTQKFKCLFAKVSIKMAALDIQTRVNETVSDSICVILVCRLLLRL